MFVGIPYGGHGAVLRGAAGRDEASLGRHRRPGELWNIFIIYPFHRCIRVFWTDLGFENVMNLIRFWNTLGSGPWHSLRIESRSRSRSDFHEELHPYPDSEKNICMHRFCVLPISISFKFKYRMKMFQQFWSKCTGKESCLPCRIRIWILIRIGNGQSQTAWEHVKHKKKNHWYFRRRNYSVQYISN